MNDQIRVHNAFNAHFPMSEYLMNCDDESAIEPLVLAYWYVITQVHNSEQYVVVDSYFISSECYIFCHKRNLMFEMNDFLHYKNLFRESKK